MDKKIIDYKKITPFIPEESVKTEWEGIQKKVEEVVDTDFGVIDFNIRTSDFGDGKRYASIQAINEKGEAFWFNTGSEIVCKKLEQIGKDSLPMKVKYVKVKDKRYHDLVSPDL